jgi:hypothetical protein
LTVCPSLYTDKLFSDWNILIAFALKPKKGISPMTEEGFKRKLVTILSAEVEGYNNLKNN